MLDATELANVWEACARRKVGHLDSQDVRTIRESAHMYLRVIDINGNGMVDYHEFFVFMLGGMEEKGPLKNMRDKLARNPMKTREIIQRFLKWDQDGDGFVTREELTEHLVEIEQLLGRRRTGLGQQLVDEMIAFGDVDGDGRFDLWEVAAHALGRRKVPVELLLYDISNGLSSKLSPILLGRHLEAIYHSSVLVYGEEYWFGGKIFKNLPPNRRCFGEPLTESRVPLQASEYFPELRVVRLGHTLATCEEFHRHLNGETSLEFTSESYDVMTHNCNTFSNEAITFLTGHGIPDAVRRLPELVVNTPTVQLLRPLLNKILGGFRGEADDQGVTDIGENGEAVTVPILDTILGQDVVIPSHILSEEHSQGAAGVSLIASVTREDSSTVDVKFFDPTSCEFHRQNRVKKSGVMTTDQHREALRSVPL